MNSHKATNNQENQEYGAIDEGTLPAEPLDLFESWYHFALDSDISEPIAMSLSTVSHDGKPSSRMVLLKQFDSDGFVFFTNYNSRKGIQISSNPNGALLFYWAEFERQIRIEGNIQKTIRKVSETYFHKRPRQSRVSAIISRQSSEVPGRAYLEKHRDDLLDQLSGKDPELPDFWGGYRLIPEYFEFWQGRRNRLHDRIVYVLEKDGSWSTKRLAP